MTWMCGGSRGDDDISWLRPPEKHSTKKADKKRTSIGDTHTHIHTKKKWENENRLEIYFVTHESDVRTDSCSRLSQQIKFNYVMNERGSYLGGLYTTTAGKRSIKYSFIHVYILCIFIPFIFLVFHSLYTTYNIAIEYGLDSGE